jgi:sugar lactone lactonase YvrE
VRSFTARPAPDHAFRLAEGPVWDAERGRVLWVDIDAGRVFEGTLRDGQVHTDVRHDFAGTVGAVVSATDGRLLVAGQTSLVMLERDGTRRAARRLLPAGATSRLNDGGCDPAGRFLVGSLSLDHRSPRNREVLYRWEFDGSVTELDADLALSNGLAWSPGGTEFYSVDTIPGTVWVRPYEPDSGRVGHREVLLHIDDSPDGLCVDRDGNLWVAVWGAGQVRCYSPGATQLATVRLAAPHPTSVAFAGPGLATLVITTASVQLSAAQLRQFPDSGRLFAVDVGTGGLPSPSWAVDRMPS